MSGAELSWKTLRELAESSKGLYMGAGTNGGLGAASRATSLPNTFLTLILLLIASKAGAAQVSQTPPPEPGSGRIVVCYYNAALAVGASKCDPPPTLVGAVYGQCANIEAAIRQEAVSRAVDGTDPQRVADIAIGYIHDHLASRIQGWVFDAQV